MSEKSISYLQVAKETGIGLLRGALIGIPIGLLVYGIFQGMAPLGVFESGGFLKDVSVFTKFGPTMMFNMVFGGASAAITRGVQSYEIQQKTLNDAKITTNEIDHDTSIGIYPTEQPELIIDEPTHSHAASAPTPKNQVVQVSHLNQIIDKIEGLSQPNRLH